MRLFLLPKKEKTIAIFDIGSGSIGGAIARIKFSDKAIPVITKSIRNELKPYNDFNSYMKDMIVVLNKTVNSLYSKKMGAPDEIVCVLASPWYISETRSIKMSKEKPFIFTKTLPSDLIKKEIENLSVLYKDKYSETKSPMEMIEHYTMSVSLNGYPTLEPLGKKCKSFQMDMVISLSPKECLDKIRDILSKTFHHTCVSFSSFTLDTYLAVRDKYVNQDSYLLIDISGEITDVGIVIKGVLKSVVSFPFGKRTFFNYFCTKLDIEQRDAEELFKLYNDNKLSDEFKNKVTPILKLVESYWGESFAKAISTLPHTLTIPNTIFLTADNDIKKWFASALCNGEYFKTITSQHPCVVTTLDGPEFLNMCDIKDGTCDPFLMIEVIAKMRKIKI
jgi:hypothetical protein